MTCRILVALDGSPASESALREVERIAQGGASVHFIQVVPRLPSSVNATSAGVMAGHDQALAFLGRLREKLPDVRGLDLIRTGDPADAILGAALEFDIDLIAMGSLVRTDPAGRILGSVAESVVRSAGIPVLLGRPCTNPAPKALRRILVPLDGSEDALTILPIVQNVASRTAAEVVFIHVSGHPVPPDSPSRPGTPPGASVDPQQKLLELADRLEKSDLEFWQTVASGDAVEEIVSHAESLDADVIAMSAQAGRENESSVVGRAALTVVDRSPRTVLLQRPVARSPAPKAWRFQ